MGIHIENISSASPKYQAVWELREEILRRPLGLSLKNEDLSRDHEDVIFIAEDDDRIVGCVLLHHLDAERCQLRAMAVYNEYQGKGIGSLLVQAAESYAREHSYTVVTLHARKVALDFYKKMDYLVTSDQFTEVGIPHFMMEKHI